MYIKKLKIENLRTLASAEMELNLPHGRDLKYPNVNVILGGNGLGKTSVLRAAALSVLGPLLSSSSGYVPDSLIRRPTDATRNLGRDSLSPANVRADIELGKDELKISRQLPANLSLETSVVTLGTSERLRWKCEPHEFGKYIEEAQFDERGTSFFVVGYGATRRVEASTRVDESARIRARLRRYERVASLFEEHIGLMPLSYWLPDYAKRNKGRYTQVLHLLNELLPDSCRMVPLPTTEDDIAEQSGSTSLRDAETTREDMFQMNGITMPFRALSDGYRAFVGWIGDMLFHACMGAGTGVKLRDLRGIVLVDEIDLHLHPEWQRTVVPTLATALPNVQFIITTHSPLVVGSLQSGNLFVLESQGDSVGIRRLPETVHGKSAEQILLSPYFGLQSTRAPDVSNVLESLANQASAGDASASAQYLELLAGGMSAEKVATLASTTTSKPGSKRKRTTAKSTAPAKKK